MQGESISFFNRSSSQQPVCTFIYLAIEKGKGECRDTLQHEKGQIDIQNPDWIIGWSWLNWLVGSAGGKRGNRCEWVITFCQKYIYYIYLYLRKKDFRRQYHALASLSDVFVFYLTKSVLIIILSYPSCVVCFIWTSFHQCFQICLHKSLQYSPCDFKNSVCFNCYVDEKLISLLGEAH